jgi:hypothetical protein
VVDVEGIVADVGVVVDVEGIVADVVVVVDVEGIVAGVVVVVDVEGGGVAVVFVAPPCSPARASADVAASAAIVTPIKAFLMTSSFRLCVSVVSYGGDVRAVVGAWARPVPSRCTMIGRGDRERCDPKLASPRRTRLPQSMRSASRWSGGHASLGDTQS